MWRIKQIEILSFPMTLSDFQGNLYQLQTFSNVIFHKIFLQLTIVSLLQIGMTIPHSIIMKVVVKEPQPQPFYGPFSGTIKVSRCQKRTSRLYGVRED